MSEQVTGTVCVGAKLLGMWRYVGARVVLPRRQPEAFSQMFLKLPPKRFRTSSHLPSSFVETVFKYTLGGRGKTGGGGEMLPVVQ